MVGQKDMNCSDKTQCVCLMAGTKGKEWYNVTKKQENQQFLVYMNARRTITKEKNKRRTKMECILAKENYSLKKPVPGILWSR